MLNNFHPKLTIFLTLVSILDIVFEIFYQVFILYFFDSFIAFLFPKVNSFLDKEYKQNILKAVKELMFHNLTNLVIISTIACLLVLILTPFFKKNVFSALRYILDFFPPFHEISNFEIIILQIQCTVIRYFESRWIWNLFIPEDSPFNKLWIVVVFSLWAPLEMRFKIFMEEKLHSNSAIVIGLVHALSVTFYPYFYLLCILKFSKSHSHIINLSFTDYFKNFNNIQCVLFNDDSHHLKITPIGCFNKNYFVIEGYHDVIGEDLSASLMYDSYKFNVAYVILNAIIPFAVNMLFALIAIQVNKRYIKYMHLEDTHHITIYLVIEELLNLGFYKYLYAPYRGIEKIFISKHDLNVGEYLNSLSQTKKETQLLHFLESEIEGHRNICSSPLSMFFNRDVNTLDRVEKAL